jgi:hypothetical protein
VSFLLLLHFIDFDDLMVGGQRAGLERGRFRLIDGKILYCNYRGESRVRDFKK